MSRLAIVLCAAVVSFAGAAPVPKEKEAKSLYLPTKVGTKWVLECGKLRAESAVTVAEEKSGEWTVTVETEQDGVKTKEDRIASAEGMFIKRPSGGRTKCLELPAAKGSKWVAETHMADGQVEVEVTFEITREEKVTVPAGEFQAVVVEKQVMRKGKLMAKSTSWHAVDVGVVKYVRGSEEWVMTSFEKPK